jgi:hypothetical protein
MRVQASLLLSVLPALDDLRRSLDPVMARRIPPHVTAIYDDEAPDPDLMIGRLEEVCTKLPPIVLHLDEVVGFEPPEEGLYVTSTASTSFTTLRTQVLRPPFAPRSASMWPHVTILHPRSAPACPANWRSYVGSTIGRSMIVVRKVSVVEYVGKSWRVRRSFPFDDAERSESGDRSFTRRFSVSPVEDHEGP